MREKIKCL